MLPNEFIRSRRPLHDAFVDACLRHGKAREEAETLWSEFPATLQAASAVVTVLESAERYEFGLPFDRLPEDTRVVGTDQAPRVDWLLLSVGASRRFLTAGQQETWLTRLGDRAKHRDALDEMLPVAWASASVSARFEVVGLGPGNTSVDWLISVPGAQDVLLDAKYRLTDLLWHLEEIVPGLNAGAREIPASTPSAEGLFRSLEKKFVSAAPQARLQGGWITAGLRHEVASLEEIFRRLDQTKVHFVLIGDWDGVRATLLQPGVDVSFLLRALRIGGEAGGVPAGAGLSG